MIVDMVSNQISIIRMQHDRVWIHGNLGNKTCPAKIAVQISHRKRVPTSRHLSHQIHSPPLINRLATSYPNHTLWSGTRCGKPQLFRRTPCELSGWTQSPSRELSQNTRVSHAASRKLACNGSGTCQLGCNKGPAPCAAASIRRC